MVLLIVVDQLFQHAVQDCRHSKKSLDCCADVAESFLVAKNLLDDESRHSLRQGLSVLHDTQTQRHYLCLHQEGYGKSVVLFDQSSNHPQRSDAEVFKDFALG